MFGIANNDRRKRIKSYCAILTSRDELNENNWDFVKALQWLKTSQDFELRIDSNVLKMPSTAGKFETLVDAAFHLLLEPPFRSQSDTEMIVLYYTGHSAPLQLAEEKKFSSPDLKSVGISREILEPANEHIKPRRLLKGGEFFLGKFGYCDLRGLLELWIVALTKSPTTKNKPPVEPAASPEKKNKHLIVIADSCLSGRFVKDLQQLALKVGPWNHNGCTVTVQSASGSDEVTYDHYFTPCFVHFNKPENRGRLEELKQKWNSKSEVEKIGYRELSLPSPEVATTMPLDKLSSTIDCPTIEFQNLPLTLFHDAGFFKFCFKDFSKIKEEPQLTDEEATDFLRHQSKFEIVDFKLKTTRHCTPLALFLVKYPNVPGRFVRVQIHFQPRETSLDHVTQVNLTGYNVPNETHSPILSEIIFEDKSAPMCDAFSDPNANCLVEQCKCYVDKDQKHPQRWSDVTGWNMTKSFKRMQKCVKN